jgi:5-hydroxyisourate hydrolase-like protein (transthyretin family)
MTLTGPRVRRVKFGRGARTTLTLRDENGRPISGAAVVVLRRMAVPGGAWVPAHPPVVTDGDGRVRYSIEPGYSRTLRFGYKAHVGDAKLAVKRELTVRVRSKTTFRTNRSFLRNGQAVRFLGRLKSRPVPRAGVVIDLQAQVGHRWQTFQTVRTKADGRWHAGYRFRRTSGLQTYVFRARVRGDTGFPYAPSVSRHTAVKVRG